MTTVVDHRTKYACAKCGIRTYKDKSSLLRHLTYECGVEPQFSCAYCPHRGDFFPTIPEGIGDSRRFECSRCGKRYTWNSGLVQHLRYECGIDPKFPCPYCPYRSRRNSDLKVHIGKKHLMSTLNTLVDQSAALANRFGCAQCGKTYKNKCTLVRHLNECGLEPTLACSYCSYRCHRKFNLTTHINLMHSELRKQKLPIMVLPARDFSTTLGSEVQILDFEKYACNICGKVYKDKKNLQRHMRFECGGLEPRFRCPEPGCSHRTHRKHDLKLHIACRHNWLLKIWDSL
ncbi:hypothetical protein LSTR_LSTR000995 [Laodelphax striatellus]|uniref:C2H2-type domain-containing protein n=1 Tax=Laodelphax striatellus TaxID=195883 RepID=A0A482X0Y1_LAOST|nr:hypothetical protein LSTR_LSTR000995 [Laodelphax striatellus]